MTLFDQLPADVLVTVMQYLSIDDLLACRLVCKQLGDMALHRDVWRYQRLTADRPTCPCAVLRLAPCLYSAVYSDKTHSSVFVTTKSAVRDLVVDVRVASDHFALGAVVVRNQEALGRLRHVKLTCRSEDGEFVSSMKFAAGKALLSTLLACSRLESLVLPIGIELCRVRKLDLHGQTQPSVKHFRCPLLNQESENFVNTVLAVHAGVLESVDLTHDLAYTNRDYYSKTGGLIAGMAKLRSLKCEVFPGMQILSACKMLIDLFIDMPDHITLGMAAGAAALLCKADQLRELSIRLPGYGYDYIFDELLQGLITSGQSKVERLTIIWLCDDSEQPLFDALPSLPALRHLVISQPLMIMPEKLLEGITPYTAPSLRVFEMRDDEKVMCVHALLHNDHVTAFFVENPLVHMYQRHTYACMSESCVPCTKGCCQQVSWNVKGHQLGLSSHDPADCPSPEDHTTGSAWTWIKVGFDHMMI